MPVEPSSEDVAQQIEYLWDLKAALTRNVAVTVIVYLDLFMRTHWIAWKDSHRLHSLAATESGVSMSTPFFNSNVILINFPCNFSQVVVTVFSPSLMLASLAKTVTLADVISWW